jgi:hypothetical protein
MIRHLRAGVIASAVLVSVSGPALAQKQGGILKVYHRDSPTSMSILEEATISTALPIMGVFNNLVVYDRNVEQNSLQSIVPDLATSWEFSEDGTQLTFKLREGIQPRLLEGGPTGNPPRPISKSARRWSGTSTRSCKRMSRARSSITTGAGPVGSPS